MVTDKLRQKGLPANAIARTTIRRGAQILGLGLLFRLQEYVIAWGWAPWSDLLRVDILNTIGVSMMLMGVVCWIVLRARPARSRQVLGMTAGGIAMVISLLTPLIWTTWRPHWLPWPIESYIDGVHNLGQPQSWLFPVFPWTAFAFAGLALGFLLLSDWTRQHEAAVFAAAGAAGVALIYLARWMDARPVQIYPVYDFWHTSPEFLFDSRGLVAGDSFRDLRVVPVGRGAVGIQSADSVGADVSAGVLGASSNSSTDGFPSCPSMLRVFGRHRLGCWRFSSACWFCRSYGRDGNGRY